MTCLIGGFRSLGISSNDQGVFTNNINNLSNDFFTNLLDMSIEWKPTSKTNYDGFKKLGRLKSGKVGNPS